MSQDVIDDDDIDNDCYLLDNSTRSPGSRQSWCSSPSTSAASLSAPGQDSTELFPELSFNNALRPSDCRTEAGQRLATSLPEVSTGLL